MLLQMPVFSLAQECSSHHFLLVTNISRNPWEQSSGTVDLNWNSHSLVIISSRRFSTHRDILKPGSSTLRKKDTSIWGQNGAFLTYHNFRTRCASTLQAEARTPSWTRRCCHDTSSPSPLPQFNSEAFSDSGEDGENRERASTPAERAKWRIAVDRGVKLESVESRQASDILDPAVLTLETETEFSGREEDTARGYSVNHASSEPIEVKFMRTEYLGRFSPVPASL